MSIKQIEFWYFAHPEVPVEYTPILNVIPTLHQATFSSNIANDGDEPRKPYKYFFHVGVGSSGNVVVETIGRRTGYTMVGFIPRMLIPRS